MLRVVGTNEIVSNFVRQREIPGKNASARQRAKRWELVPGDKGLAEITLLNLMVV
jgi:hypothetical protein